MSGEHFHELIEDQEIAEAISIIRDAGTMLDDPVDPPSCAIRLTLLGHACPPSWR
jgi:hypothetical protein